MKDCVALWFLVAGALPVPSAAAPAGQIPKDLTAAALIEAVRPIIVVDIRPAREKPPMPALGSVKTVVIPWPSQPYRADSNEPHVRFFRALRNLQGRNPGVPLVLVCGAGERTRQALALARQFGMHGGLSHVVGGLNGNDRDPGLLLELDMR